MQGAHDRTLFGLPLVDPNPSALTSQVAPFVTGRLLLVAHDRPPWPDPVPLHAQHVPAQALPQEDKVSALRLQLLGRGAGPTALAFRPRYIRNVEIKYAKRKRMPLRKATNVNNARRLVERQAMSLFYGTRRLRQARPDPIGGLDLRSLEAAHS